MSGNIKPLQIQGTTTMQEGRRTSPISNSKKMAQKIINIYNLIPRIYHHQLNLYEFVFYLDSQLSKFTINFDSKITIFFYFQRRKMGTTNSAKQNFHTTTDVQVYFSQSKRKGILPSKDFLIEDHLNKVKPFKENQQFLGKPQMSQKEPSRSSIIKASAADLDNLRESIPFMIEYPQKYPYSAIGVVHSIRNGRQVIGTGCLIGPNLVLTCAHNCFTPQLSIFHEQIQFIPSPIENHLRKNEQSLRNKGFKVKGLYIPSPFQKKANTQEEIDEVYIHDYAVLLLDSDENIEEYFGSLGYNFNWDQSREYRKEMENNKEKNGFSICGYYPGYDSLKFKEFHGSVLFQPSYLIYVMKTQPGLSGSPVFSQSESGYFVRAIHQSDVSKILKTQKKDLSRKAGLKLSWKIFEDLKKNFTSSTQKHIYSLESQNMSGEDLRTAIAEINAHEEEMNTERSVLSIRLNNNSVGLEGCQSILKAQWPNLQQLYLNNNQINDDGCLFLAQGQWKSLKTLQLWGNCIGDKGCKHLSTASWSHLLLLYLAENRIGEEGCRHLSLSQWPKLSKLNLRGNKIGRTGYCYFKDMNCKVYCDSKFRSNY